MQTKQNQRQILFISLEHWDEVWRRNQIVCAELLRRHPDAQILWVGPPTDLWNAPGLKSINAPLGTLFQPAKNISRLYALKPFKPLPNVLGKGLNQWLFKHAVARAMTQLGWQNHIAWVNNQAYCRLLPTPRTQLIYDITDDWTHATAPAHILEQIKADDQWMLAHADDVIVCSDDLYRNKVESCNKIHLIRNGVTIEPYLPESLANKTIPKDIQFSTTVAGYVGTLHEDRLDVELIVNVANKLTNVQFVFVGPNSLSANSTAALQSLPNCHILGARPYDTVPSYLAGFDICITPHVVTPFTESLDPIKMYEYMATGKPIVATACAGFRDLDSLIYVARNCDQFVDLIEQAKTEKSERTLARIDWARKQTWEQRVDDIEKILNWNEPVENNSLNEVQAKSPQS